MSGLYQKPLSYAIFIKPALVILMVLLNHSLVLAQDNQMDTSSQPVQETTSDTSGSTQIQNAGVGVNGSLQDSTVNNNSNNLSTGNNTNLNMVAPTIINPSETRSVATGGVGGNSVLMLPRNPLPLSNAALGRSNFGLQFGLQNNPILGGLSSLGQQNALGWYMQAGLTIPFGKIPNALASEQNFKLDDARQDNLERRRNVFGSLSNSTTGAQGLDYKTKVKGKLSGMSAYNFSAIPSSKIDMPVTLNESGSVKLSPPKILALAPAEIYSKPLHTGSKIGVVEVGNEYPYLGHTRSGWIKVLLPNGAEGWTSTHFEYIKNDYTQIDDLAIAPGKPEAEKTVSSLDSTPALKQQPIVKKVQ